MPPKIAATRKEGTSRFSVTAQPTHAQSEDRHEAGRLPGEHHDEHGDGDMAGRSDIWAPIEQNWEKTARKRLISMRNDPTS